MRGGGVSRARAPERPPPVPGTGSGSAWARALPGSAWAAAAVPVPAAAAAARGRHREEEKERKKKKKETKKERPRHRRQQQRDERREPSRLLSPPPPRTTGNDPPPPVPARLLPRFPPPFPSSSSFSRNPPRSSRPAPPPQEEEDEGWLQHRGQARGRRGVPLPRVGVQDGVEPGLEADPAVALHPGAAAEGGVPARHRLAAGRVRRVRHQGPRRGGAALGAPQVQAPDELRQAQPRPQILLQQEDPAQDQGQKIHLQIQLQQAGDAQLSLHQHPAQWRGPSERPARAHRLLPLPLPPSGAALSQRGGPGPLRAGIAAAAARRAGAAGPRAQGRARRAGGERPGLAPGPAGSAARRGRRRRRRGAQAQARGGAAALLAARDVPRAPAQPLRRLAAAGPPRRAQRAHLAGAVAHPHALLLQPVAGAQPLRRRRQQLLLLQPRGDEALPALAGLLRVQLPPEPADFPPLPAGGAAAAVPGAAGGAAAVPHQAAAAARRPQEPRAPGEPRGHRRHRRAAAAPRQGGAGAGQGGGGGGEAGEAPRGGRGGAGGGGRGEGAGFRPPGGSGLGTRPRSARLVRRGECGENSAGLLRGRRGAGEEGGRPDAPQAAAEAPLERRFPAGNARGAPAQRGLAPAQSRGRRLRHLIPAGTKKPWKTPGETSVYLCSKVAERFGIGAGRGAG